MTRQQAGVSAEAVAKLVALREMVEASRNGFLDGQPYVLTYSDIVEELRNVEAALATATPEQASEPLSSKALEALAEDILADANCTAEKMQSIWERAIFDKQNGWQVLADLFNANRPSAIASPQAASGGAQPEEVIDRITEYLSSGGLFNPEMALHERVRQLLADSREALANLAAHDQKVRAEATLAEHQSHVEFESELYATLVDPVAEGSIKEAEMRKQLLEQARWYRQRVYDLEQALPLDARRLKMILLDVIVLADAGKWKGQLSTVNYARAALASGAEEK